MWLNDGVSCFWIPCGDEEEEYGGRGAGKDHLTRGEGDGSGSGKKKWKQLFRRKGT